MATFDVAGVRAVEDGLAVRGNGDVGLVLDQTVRGRQDHRRRVRFRDVDAVVTVPLVEGTLGLIRRCAGLTAAGGATRPASTASTAGDGERKDHVRAGAAQIVHVVELSVTLRWMPDLMAFAGGDVGGPEGDAIPAPERGGHQAGGGRRGRERVDAGAPAAASAATGARLARGIGRTGRSEERR